MSMEWRTLPEFTLKYIENLQCLIHLNDFVDQSSLRPFSHLFETATRKFTRGTVGPSHLQILRQFLTHNSAWQSCIPAQNHCYLIHLVESTSVKFVRNTSLSVKSKALNSINLSSSRRWRDFLCKFILSSKHLTKLNLSHDWWSVNR